MSKRTYGNGEEKGRRIISIRKRTFKRMQQLAQPLQDTPDDVINMLLDLFDKVYNSSLLVHELARKS